jgi:hypothetical protein
LFLLLYCPFTIFQEHAQRTAAPPRETAWSPTTAVQTAHPRADRAQIKQALVGCLLSAAHIASMACCTLTARRLRVPPVRLASLCRAPRAVLHELLSLCRCHAAELPRTTQSEIHNTITHHKPASPFIRIPCTRHRIAAVKALSPNPLLFPPSRLIEAVQGGG